MNLSNANDRFEILRHLALSGSRGDDLAPAIKAALDQASQLTGLAEAAIYLWDAEMAVNLTVNVQAGERLNKLEDDLFRTLRRDRDLMSAYLQFGGHQPYQTFTLPLRHGSSVFGAVVGVSEGQQKLIDQDMFLEALSAAISVNVTASGLAGQDVALKERIDKERLAAILDTAVTVNHEINNPLTAILGNVQLLLLNDKNLDDGLAKKLRTIEASAMRIKDITQRLLNLKSARSVEYTEGSTMLDLGEDNQHDK